jgi:hypothetical protein
MQTRWVERQAPFDRWDHCSIFMRATIMAHHARRDQIRRFTISETRANAIRPSSERYNKVDTSW